MSPRHPEARYRRPDFFLVGGARCGTTSMYSYLKQHPQIYLSVLKEPHFFSTDLTRSPRAVSDEALYRSLFQDVRNEKRVGEGSVSYLESRRAPEAIRAFSPGARILVMVRNPIDTAFSLHSLYTRTGNEDILDFDAALEAEEARRRQERIPATAYFPEGLLYTDVVRHAKKLERYCQVFGREQVHVVVFDDFVARPAQAYRGTLEFLEVEPGFEAEFDRGRAQARIWTKVARQMRTAAPGIRARMRGLGQHHTAPKKPMSLDTRQRLAELFRDEVEALSTLLKRDLSAWCDSNARVS